MAILRTVIVVLLGLGLVAGGFLAYVYRWLMTRPVPDLTGQVSFKGLDHPVTIQRDRHGVPHIRAQSNADLFRAQGYVHAQDRFWSMEMGRRIARGTLAERFGEAALIADRYSRTIGFQRAAEEEWAQLRPRERDMLNWYAEGVNEYRRSRKGRLAAEFRLLRYEPEPWTPVDSLGIAKVVGWSLSLNWDSELLRMMLATRMGAAEAAELEDLPHLDMPAIRDALDGATESKAMRTAEALLQAYESTREFWPIFERGQGSNSWVVNRPRTEDGRTLVCNDPHLQVALPCQLYEQHLTSPEIDVAGATFAGAPGCVFGHNQHVAWAITAALTDVQDLFVERLDPDRSGYYEHHGQWRALTEIRETFHVKGFDQPVEEVVRLTRHGPLISDLVPETEGLPLALQWTGHQPGHMFDCILKLMQARTCEDGIEAMREWNTPPLNISFGDTAGDIAYKLVGRHPVRSSGHGLVPAPGWSDAGDWVDFIPYDQLQTIHNPPDGVIVTANNRVTRADAWMGCEFDPGYRAQRIQDLLTEHAQLSVGDMKRIQLDSYSVFAERLTAELIRVEVEDSWDRHALQTLANWNHRMETTSEGALLFHYILNGLLHEAFGMRMEDLGERYLGRVVSPLFNITGFRWTASDRLLTLLQHHRHSTWYADAESGRSRTREEFLRAGIHRGVARVRQEMGDSTRKWVWGRVHQIKFSHILGSVSILKPLINRGPYPIAGDNTTPLMTAYMVGSASGLVQSSPMYRTVMEVGHWDTMISVINTGQSGHPVSRHYDDQMGLWREGEYHVMPFSEKAVNDVTVYTLRLNPESA